MACVVNIAALRTSSFQWAWNSRMCRWLSISLIPMETGDFVFFFSSLHFIVLVESFVFCSGFKFDNPGRTFPCNLPAWMVVLETTLGCKQGTLWKAPRNAEREVKDTNTFCRNDFWNFVACKASKPLPPSTSAHLACFFFI